VPLIQGSSKEVISENIRELMRSGKYPHRQAIAIALSSARKMRKLDDIIFFLHKGDLVGHSFHGNQWVMAHQSGLPSLIEQAFASNYGSKKMGQLAFTNAPIKHVTEFVNKEINNIQSKLKNIKDWNDKKDLLTQWDTYRNFDKIKNYANDKKDLIEALKWQNKNLDDNTRKETNNKLIGMLAKFDTGDDLLDEIASGQLEIDTLIRMCRFDSELQDDVDENWDEIEQLYEANGVDSDKIEELYGIAR